MGTQKVLTPVHAPCTMHLTMNALDKALSLLGGTANLARALGVAPNVVSNWRKRGVPVEVCPQIERATERRVLCEELNNSVDWQYVRDSVKSIAESRPTDSVVDRAATRDDTQALGGSVDNEPKRKDGGSGRKTKQARA